jgi:phosphoribosylglycinamide formyltransferase-1
MKKIVVLVSGRGSNMRALAQACRDEKWPAEIVAVVSDRADAQACVTARELGLRVELVEARLFAERASFFSELGERLDALAPDLIALAGFMRILPDELVARFAGKMLNVHPSLLPAFSGLHTHRRALEAGARVHGATVHYVIPELDAGPIVAQAAVPVFDDDDPDRLAARVLNAEHRIFPLAVRWHIEGRLRCAGQRVILDPPRPGEAQSLWLT